MADTFNLRVLTPKEQLFEGAVSTVNAPGFEGDFGVLSGHVAYITAVKPGAMILEGKDGNTVYAVGDGFAQVSADRVSIVVSSAVAAADIDVAQAHKDLAEAEGALMHATPGETDYNDATLKQALALGRIAAAERVGA